jgi:hypothetical protein
MLFLHVKINTNQLFQQKFHNFFRYNYFSDKLKIKVKEKYNSSIFYSSSAFKTPEGLSPVLLIYWPSV